MRTYMKPNAEPTPETGVSVALLDSLVQTSFTVIGIVTAVAAAHDLSLTLLRVGAILRDRTLTMSELAAYLGLDRSTITGLVNRAEERGLVRRIGNENDKRSTQVTLTRAGQDLARICAAEISQEIAPLVAPLATTEANRLAELLTLTLTTQPRSHSQRPLSLPAG